MRPNDSIGAILSDCCGVSCFGTLRRRLKTGDVEHAMSDEDHRFVRCFDLHEVKLHGNEEEEIGV